MHVGSEAEPARPAGRVWRPVRSARAAAWVLLVALAGGGCGTATGPGGPLDPCAAAPLQLVLGQTVAGVLDAATDCFEPDARLGDRYLLTLTDATLFRVTLATEGYLPFVPTYLGEDQLSGWASDSALSLAREHLFPAGSYVVRASTFAQATSPESAPQGPYTLSTERLDTPQEGCGRETSITYGSIAEGRIAPDDCRRAPADEPGRARLSDGYAAIVAAARDLVVTATADFPFRLQQVDDGVPSVASPWLPPGSEASLVATGAGFHDFWVLAESDDALGAYRIRFDGPATAPAPPAAALGSPPAHHPQDALRASPRIRLRSSSAAPSDSDANPGVPPK